MKMGSGHWVPKVVHPSVPVGDRQPQKDWGWGQIVEAKVSPADLVKVPA